ncbi:MAG: hypothetical protein KatS3mg105_1793 [Gemmatales bacterium]|nr:MAG: hypothetical protein KatS3mg105_1793 [Gemmatales bacterium]
MTPFSPQEHELAKGIDPASMISRLYRAGTAPPLEKVVRVAADAPVERIVSALAIDQWHRWHRGERIAAEDYFNRFPVLETAADAFDLVFGEYLVREELGESPTLEEYLARFPQFSTELKRQFELHAMIESTSAEEDHNRGDESTISSGYERADSPRQKDTKSTRESKKATDFPDLPGYEILCELGRGGMGYVYKARHTRLNRIVALKLIRRQLFVVDEETISRFEREAQAAAQLSHPNIVLIYNLDEFDDIFYITMEYVDGIDLHRLVQQQGPLPARQACEYIRQAALGLQHAYEHGLVHRDIKPANLLVTQRKSSDAAAGIVKISDLGLVLVPDRAGQSNLTKVGAVIGTPDYLSPEQANDPHNVDIRADIYSLGCTFYYLLTGKAPFEDAELLQKLVMHQTMHPTRVNEIRKDVPAKVADIIRKMMAKRPEDRYATPAQVARALAKFGADDWSPPAEGSQVDLNKTPAPHDFQALISSVSLTTRREKPENNDPDSLQGARRAKHVALLKGHRGCVTALAFSPDRSCLASGAVDGALRLWALRSSSPPDRVVPQAHNSDINAIAYSHDGAYLATASGALEAFIIVWRNDGSEVTPWATLPVGNSTIGAIAFSPVKHLLAAASSDRRIHVWDVSGGEPRETATLKGHSSYVTTVSFASDGIMLASGSENGSVRVWNLSKYWSKEHAAVGGNWGRISALTLSPSGRFLAFGGPSQIIYIYEVTKNSLEPYNFFQGHAGTIMALQFTPDERSLFSVCNARQVVRWRLEDGSIETEWKLERGHQLATACFDGPARTLATGRTDGAIALFRFVSEADS